MCVLKLYIDLPPSRYAILERVSAVRRKLLEAEMNMQARNTMSDQMSPIFCQAQQVEQELRIKTSQAARISGNIQSALNIIASFKISKDENMKEVTLHAKEEFAEVLWVKGEQSLALGTLKEVQKHLAPSSQASIQMARLVSPIVDLHCGLCRDSCITHYARVIELGKLGYFRPLKSSTSILKRQSINSGQPPIPQRLDKYHSSTQNLRIGSTAI